MRGDQIRRLKRENRKYADMVDGAHQNIIKLLEMVDYANKTANGALALVKRYQTTYGAFLDEV